MKVERRKLNDKRITDEVLVANIMINIIECDNGALLMELSIAEAIKPRKIALRFNNVDEIRSLADYIVGLAEEADRIFNDKDK
jgi:hypothetical protein